MAVDHEVLDYAGVTRALEIAASGDDVELTDLDHKMVGLLLHEGECDASMKAPWILVRYSWRLRFKPSRYFGRLMPGTLKRLMDLGGIDTVDLDAQFSVGPGTTGPGKYEKEFSKKWLWILCEEEEIKISVRSKESDLNVPLSGEDLELWRDRFVEIERRKMQRQERRATEIFKDR